MLLFIMSVSGSIVFLLILALKQILKNNISAVWIYNMLKVNLLFFFIPLPLVKEEYTYLIRRIFSFLGMEGSFIGMYLFGGDILQITQTGEMIYRLKNILLCLWLLWVMVFLILGCIRFRKYRAMKKRCINNAIAMNADTYTDVLGAIQKDIKLRHKVTLLCTKKKALVCTYGIFRKTILVPRDGFEKLDLSFILKHELIHIKRWDVLVRVIAIIGICVHWFNPLVYIYFYLLSVYCEMSCDLEVIKDSPKENLKEYGKLLINMALEGDTGRYRISFSNKNTLERRIRNMKNKKKMRGVVKAAVLLASVIIMWVGSLPALAYEDPQIIQWETERRMGDGQDGIVRQFIASSEETKIDTNSNRITYGFVDINNNRHQIDKIQNNVKGICFHKYIEGYYSEHIKYSNNSCRTDYYNAEFCEKCSKVIVHSFSHTETSTKCLHV